MFNNNIGIIAVRKLNFVTLWKYLGIGYYALIKSGVDLHHLMNDCDLFL